MEEQATLSAVLLPLRNPSDQFIRQHVNPALHAATQIKRKHLPDADEERDRVEPLGVVPLRVPPQVLPLRSEPAQQDHGHGGVPVAADPAPRAVRGRRSSAPGGEGGTVARVRERRAAARARRHGIGRAVEWGERRREVEGARARRGRPRVDASGGGGAASRGGAGAAAEEERERRGAGGLPRRVVVGLVVEEEEAAVEGGRGQFPDRSFHRRGTGRSVRENCERVLRARISDRPLVAAEAGGVGNEGPLRRSIFQTEEGTNLAFPFEKYPQKKKTKSGAFSTLSLI